MRQREYSELLRDERVIGLEARQQLGAYRFLELWEKLTQILERVMPGDEYKVV